MANLLLDRLTDLAACLCAQIEEDGLPPTCFCGVIPGDVAVGDYAGDCDVSCGMAWVRLITSYPATGVGAADETAGNCSASLGVDIEVGIMRCMDVHEDGTPLSAEELLEVARLQTADMMAMWRAVFCCNSLSNKDFILNAYQPLGPMGGLVGGAFVLRTVL